MTVIGTCGHKLKGVDDNVLHIKDFSGGERIVTQIVVCNSCAKSYKKMGIILEDEEAERKWFEGDK